MDGILGAQAPGNVTAPGKGAQALSNGKLGGLVIGEPAVVSAGQRAGRGVLRSGLMASGLALGDRAGGTGPHWSGSQGPGPSRLLYSDNATSRVYTPFCL